MNIMDVIRKDCLVTCVQHADRMEAWSQCVRCKDRYPAEPEPTVNINTALGAFHCRRCGFSGDAFSWVMYSQRTDMDGALSYLNMLVATADETMPPEKCLVCGAQVVPTDAVDPTCANCQQLVPPSLAKALCDEFYYALRTRDGSYFQFSRARLVGAFVHLWGMRASDFGSPTAHPFDRGVDVRLSDIVWCADAPDGS